jgi:hypothetical protein
MSMKNFSDTIGNRTRDLPACSAVFQPIAPPRAPNLSGFCSFIFTGIGQDLISDVKDKLHFNSL